MSELALELDHVSKKFRRGEIYDSLRDWIPAMIGRILGRSSSRDLSAREFWALKDVSLSVRRGEVLGIIGHNGAGKSTMLSAQWSLEAKLKERFAYMANSPHSLKRCGLHSDLTGRQNIYLNGAILGMSRTEVARKFDQIVAFSGLEEFLDTPVKRYSTGMYARLGFSVAAHVDPDILIVDEVLSVGDYAFQNRCMDRMKEVVKSGAAVVFVSHDLHSVVNLCSRAILLDHGCIAKGGTPQEVIQSYLKNVKKSNERYGEKEAYISQLLIRGVVGPQVRFETGDDAWLDIDVCGNTHCERLSLSIYIQDERGYEIFNTSTELTWVSDLLTLRGSDRAVHVPASAWPRRRGIQYRRARLSVRHGKDVR